MSEMKETKKTKVEAKAETKVEDTKVEAKAETKVEDTKVEAKVETVEQTKVEAKPKVEVKANTFVKYVAPVSGTSVLLGDTVVSKKGTAVVDKEVWSKLETHIGGYLKEITKAEFEVLQKSK